MPFIPRSAAAVAAACVLAALPGCSPSPQVLATVGDRTITVDEFKDQARMLSGRIGLPPDSAKAMLMRELIQRELVLAAGTRTAIPDSALAARRREIEEDALGRALMQQLAPQDVGVSDAEVKQLYLWRHEATHVQVAFSPDEATARLARQAVDRGEDFGQVATRLDVTGTLPPNGDLGLVEPGQLVNPLDTVVRTAKVGSIVGPFEAPGQGWFLVKVLGREPREHGPLAQQADELRGMLEQRKRRATLVANYSQLRDAYAIVPDPNVLTVLYDRLNAFRAAQGSPLQPAAPQLSPRERAMVACRWDGGGPGLRGSLTLGDIMDLLQSGRAPRFDAMRLNAYPDWVKAIALQRVIVQEARRRRLDQEPDVARRIREQTDQYVFETVFQNEVVSRAEPTDAEVQAAFARNAESFAQVRSVTVQSITLPDSASAMTLGRKLVQAGAAPLKETVPFAAPGLAVREEVVRYPTTDPLWQMLQPAFMQAAPGQLLGPLHQADGWRILQVVHRDMPAPAFAALTPEQQQGLRQQARQFALERTMRAYTDSLRTRIPVTVRQDLLAKIEWPAPSMEDMLRRMQQGG